MSVEREIVRLAERLDVAIRVLGGAAAVAEILGVDSAQISRWREGEIPNWEERDRIIVLDAVVALLSGYLADSTIPKWLWGMNAYLNNRTPASLLRQGHFSEVIAAITSMKAGGFA